MEIVEASLAPLAGVLLLVQQTVFHFLPAARVVLVGLQDEGTHLLPDGVETVNFCHTAVIVRTEFLPERTTALHLMCPGYVVEPEQQVFGAGLEVIIA